MKGFNRAERQYLKALREAFVKAVVDTDHKGVEEARRHGIVAWSLLRMSAELHLGLTGGEEFFKRSAEKIFDATKKDFEAALERKLKEK